MSNLKDWKHRTDDVTRALHVQVVVGGTSNVVVGAERWRNTGRDLLMQLLDEQGISWFNPEIHESTHGRRYNYEIDGPVEQAALDNAQVIVLELSNLTPAPSTMIEALKYAIMGRRLVVVFDGEGGIDPPTCQKILRIVRGEEVPDDVVKLSSYYPNPGFDLATLAASERSAIETRFDSDAKATMSARKLLLKTLRDLRDQGLAPNLTILSC